MNTIDSIVAKALAEADAKVQADFLNEFYRFLKLICHGRHDTQLSYISDYLDPNGRELCESLSEFAKMALDSRAKIEAEISDLHGQRNVLEREISELIDKREQLTERISKIE